MADPERHKELIRRWFEEGVASNDPEVVRRVADEVFTEDFVDGDSPDAPRSRDAFKRMITERMYRAFADVDAKVEHVLAEGDLAAAYVRISMTHVGEFYGLAGTGTRITFHEAAISGMRDGRIAWTNGKPDWIAVLQQLGIAPRRPEAERRLIEP
jgi:predicted ester cyclase